MPMVRCGRLVFRTDHVSSVELDFPVHNNVTRIPEHGTVLTIHGKRFTFVGREAQALRAWALANCALDLGSLADFLDESPGADAGAVAPGLGPKPEAEAEAAKRKHFL